MMQSKYPQKPGIDFILKQAFFYWNKTLVFQLMFSMIFLESFLRLCSFWELVRNMGAKSGVDRSFKRRDKSLYGKDRGTKCHRRVSDVYSCHLGNHRISLPSESWNVPDLQET